MFHCRLQGGIDRTHHGTRRAAALLLLLAHSPFSRQIRFAGESRRDRRGYWLLREGDIAPIYDGVILSRGKHSPRYFIRYFYKLRRDRL